MVDSGRDRNARIRRWIHPGGIRRGTAVVCYFDVSLTAIRLLFAFTRTS